MTNDTSWGCRPPDQGSVDAEGASGPCGGSRTRVRGPPIPQGFLHRFGSSLNPRFHFHLCVVDGLFEQVAGDTDQNSADPEPRLQFHEATALTPQLLESLQHTVRSRVLRRYRRHDLLEPHEAEDMLTWEHGGGFTLDGSVRVEATDRAGLERLIRYRVRPPFALERLHLARGRFDQVLYVLPRSDLAGRTALGLSALELLDRLAKILPPPRLHRHRYHGVFAPNAPLRPLVTERAHQDNALAAQNPATSAPALLARIYETFPLTCPTCAAPSTLIAVLTDPEPIAQILAHIGEPSSPPRLHRDGGRPRPSSPSGSMPPTTTRSPRSTPRTTSIQHPLLIPAGRITWPASGRRALPVTGTRPEPSRSSPSRSWTPESVPTPPSRP